MLTGDQKTALGIAFQQLRARGVLARQNYTCCQSCGCAAMQARYDDELSKTQQGATVGFAFYHKQDAERLRASGEGHITFGTFGDDDSADERKTVAVGRIVADELRRAGLTVDWDGTSAQRVGFTFAPKKEGAS